MIASNFLINYIERRGSFGLKWPLSTTFIEKPFV